VPNAQASATLPAAEAVNVIQKRRVVQDYVFPILANITKGSNDTVLTRALLHKGFGDYMTGEVMQYIRELTGQPFKDIDSIFDYLDVDGDGEIRPMEFMRGMCGVMNSRKPVRLNPRNESVRGVLAQKKQRRSLFAALKGPGGGGDGDGGRFEPLPGSWAAKRAQKEREQKQAAEADRDRGAAFGLHNLPEALHEATPPPSPRSPPAFTQHPAPVPQQRRPSWSGGGGGGGSTSPPRGGGRSWGGGGGGGGGGGVVVPPSREPTAAEKDAGERHAVKIINAMMKGTDADKVTLQLMKQRFGMWLNSVEMEYIRQLTGQPLKSATEVFAFLDFNGDGELTVIDFIRGLCLKR
jgi:uncharacterized membrane protein YgcG